MIKFIHMTDTHLVAPGRRLYGLDPEARLRAAVESINREQADAAFVAITGDLTDKGDRAAFALLKEITSELVPPCHLLVGNHDDHDAFYEVFPDAPRDENGFAQFTFDLGDALGVALDTLVEGTDAGHLCDRRLGWLDRTLGALAGRPYCLFLHHSPAPIGIPALDAIALQQPERLAALFERHGAPRHIFFGHVHRPIAGSWRGIPLSTLPGTNHQVGLRFDLPAGVYPGDHGFPAYGVVLMDGQTTIVHTHAFLEKTPAFALEDAAAEAAARPEDLPPLADPRPTP